MTSGSAAATAAAVSLGNGEVRRKQQTRTVIRAGKGGGGADVSLAAPANEVTALSTLALNATSPVVSPRDQNVYDIQKK